MGTKRFEIRPLAMEDWNNATALIWRVFLRCNASDYEQEGIESFLNFISDEHLKQFCRLQEFEMFGAYLGQRLIGACMIRGGSHISLLFIETEWQGQGVGRSFIEYVSSQVFGRGKDALTVNAAPFAREFYLKMGFRQTREEQLKEGIRYFPMVLSPRGYVGMDRPV